MTDIVATGQIPYLSGSKPQGPKLNGVPLNVARVVRPAFGLWHIDATLAGMNEPAGSQVFTYSNMTLKCAIYRSILFAGVRRIRLIAGTGGLRNVLPPKGYAQGGGVQLSLVLGDLMQESGEQIVATDRSLGQAWIRGQGPASLTLRNLFGNSWWADDTGVMQTKDRDTTAITSSFVAMNVEGAVGLYTIATETPEDWLPGRSFSGPTVSGVISRVTHDISSSAARTWVMIQ